MTIKFGTDGWRGVIGVDFTQDRLIRVCQALGEYALDKAKSPVRIIVGYDTRFMSAEFAQTAADVLSGTGHEVWLTAKPIATPVLSFAVRRWQAAAGLMVTASHNPPKYNGIKFKGFYGGSLLPEEIANIEKYLFAQSGNSAINTGYKKSKQITVFNPDGQYLAHLSTLLNKATLASGSLTVVVDAMHGSARGYLEEFLGAAGLSTVSCRNEINPSFGGVNPEPIEANLQPLRLAVLASQADVGVATDGDGDRLGAMDEHGSYVGAQQLFPLLLSHLVENRGWRGKVCKTFSTTSKVDLVAAKYNLPVITTPIGFKYICEYFLTTEVLMGGEESGGFGFQKHLPERDGIFSALLLLELMASKCKPLSTLLSEQDREFGSHFYQRVDLELSPSRSTDIPLLLQNLVQNPDKPGGCSDVPGLASWLGIPLVTVSQIDGVKFTLQDGSWLLLRPSGTEPVLRLYAEAPLQEQAGKMLAWARRVTGETNNQNF